jgi:diguanylate cyclase (GGDEF)-like protein
MSTSSWPEDPAGGFAFGPLPTLASMLARAESGIRFIYQALDLLADSYHLSDAVLGIEDQMGGLQMFRLQRAPVRDLEGDRVLLGQFSGRGLIADPDVVDPVTASYVIHLAQVAFRLDLLSHDAGHDPLTGLLNRRSYETSLHLAVSRSRRYGWPFALISLDLDGFKKVNDLLGHQAGDEVLRAIGVEVRVVMRGGDVAARVGGDEFALLVQNVHDGRDIEPLLARLAETLSANPSGVGIRFSAGIAYFPGDASDAESLAKLADMRLYAAKQQLVRPSTAPNGAVAHRNVREKDNPSWAATPPNDIRHRP